MKTLKELARAILVAQKAHAASYVAESAETRVGYFKLTREAALAAEIPDPRLARLVANLALNSPDELLAWAEGAA